VLLLLFDIDGTLLQGGAVEHAEALRTAAASVHGLDALDGKVEVAGRTDRAIARDLLAHAGVSEIRDWEQAAVEAYKPPDLTAKVAPGVAALLAELAARPDEFRLSLVTGNLEAIAHRKLAAAGIGHYFEAGQGGFGSDDEDRAKLPGIARARASSPPWPRERTVVIGDTPRDIHCARADEVRVAAVATGHFSVEQLAEADAVVDDARSLLPVLTDWARPSA
jgi:phosphoglycolate phosphatase-like HAD superfamily hydrolase